MTYGLKARYLESVEFREQNNFVILYDRIFGVIKMRDFEYQNISVDPKRICK